MSNLSENIKKHLLCKIVDIIEIIVLVFAMFYALTLFENIFYLIIAFVLVLIVFSILSKYTSIYLNKWKVQELSYGEKIKLNWVDTIYMVVVAIVFILVFKEWINYKVVVVFFLVLILTIQISKWWKLRKELRQETDEIINKAEGKETDVGIKGD